MFIQRYYEDLTRLHVGAEPPRAYFVPDSVPQDDRGDLRMRSDRFVSLDGEWGFRYYPSVYDLDEEVTAARAQGRKPFYDDGFDMDGDAGIGVCDRIEVPSVWQMQGYDQHQYANTEYPFPYDPPCVPQDDPCAVYLRDFTYDVDSTAPRAFLNFEGVDSCFYVWLNGTFVGYSQVSHSTSEFEVTRQLRRGRNRVAVLVLKWCDGSYLEDQDKFRMSGIFRSVYLLRRPQDGIRDYFVHTDLHDDYGRAEVRVDVDFLAPRSSEEIDGNHDVNSEPTTVGRNGRPAAADAVSGSVVSADAFVGNLPGRPCPVVATLYDPQGSLVGRSEARPGGDVSSLTFSVDKPMLWNAEQPDLYRLVLETFARDEVRPGDLRQRTGAVPVEVITEYIGIRDVSVDGNVVKVNGRPIKIHGVNRHDSDPRTGYAISQEQIMRDLTLMKEHNVNAIRTSHYPNAPHYYALYDKLGFYVIAESDMETHGIDVLYEKRANRECWNGKISDEPRFIQPIVDRVQRNVEGQKNHPGVIIWSMGNESGYGCGFEEALKWTKERDSSRLTHYEAAIHGSPRSDLDYSNLDIYSRMYPSVEAIDAYFTPEGPHGTCENGDDGDDGSRPYFLCEFSHAMGNSPGDLEDYFHAFQRHDGMLGGCVWEWCDHAVDMGHGTNGRRIYFYGGDHGEFPNAANFCMDGLVYPDRTPHTGLKEFKNVFRPARVVGFEPKSCTLTVHNYMDFVDLSDYVTISWQLLVDGEAREQGYFAPSAERGAASGLPGDMFNAYCGPVVGIAAHREGSLKLPHLDVPGHGKVTLLVRYRLRRAGSTLPQGFDLGFDEVPVQVANRSNVSATAIIDSAVSQLRVNSIGVGETSRQIVLTSDNWRYVFDRRTGLVDSMSVGERSLLAQPAQLNVWRAPTDNDIYAKKDWQDAGYSRAYCRAYDCEAKPDAEGAVHVNANIAIVAPVIQPIAQVGAEWVVNGQGVVSMTLHVSRDAATFPFLPRFGLRLLLPKAMNRVEYCGYGPYESYVDKHMASWYGDFTSTAQGLTERYLKPQENGSHFGTDVVEVSSGILSLAVASPKSFSFNCSPYTQEELTLRLHDYELEASPYTVLCLDYAQSGMGSNSCGPQLARRHRLDEAGFDFSLTLRPQVR